MTQKQKILQLAYGINAMKWKEKWPVYLNILSSRHCVSILQECLENWFGCMWFDRATFFLFFILHPGKAVPRGFKRVREIHQAIFLCPIWLHLCKWLAYIVNVIILWQKIHNIFNHCHMSLKTYIYLEVIGNSWIF